MQRSTNEETSNRLIAALPRRSRLRLMSACDLVDLEFAKVLCRKGQHVAHAYFPLTGFVSVVTSLRDGAQLEVGIIGNEGMVGAALVFGVNTCPQDLIVQGAGRAWRMPAAAFRRELGGDTALQRTLHRYMYVLMAQLAQTAVCNRFHSLEARLARWLLSTRDRSGSSSFFVTHEFLAYMLGVRRAGVTSAATSLRDRGLIRYSRGEVRILDGSGLQNAACRCYRQANATYRSVLGAR